MCRSITIQTAAVLYCGEEGSENAAAQARTPR